ncbi:MAG: Na+/H+ antiporter NhaC family protein [Oscillospiraceae bacterium]|nr:Na+/H+ antiporter NhaC family protein [Oscillospiraceae bacterium]
MKNNRRLWVHALALAIVALLCILSALSAGTERDGPPEAVYSSALALLPPLVAIVLSLVTKEVYSALFVGVVVGALLYSGGNAELALNTLLFHEEGGLVTGLTDMSHASVLVFVTLLGTFVVLVNQSGGAAAFGRWAEKHIRSRAGAQIATILLGLLIFVDDGFNCMTVGSVMRPMTDRHRVSRAKLAWLLDSTAAPVCIIAPISCWAAAVSYAVPAEYEINGFRMFLRTIPYNFYALTTIVMLFAVVLLRADYGPMRRHEQNAIAGDLFTSGKRAYEEEEKASQSQEGEGALSNLVIPVVVLIAACIAGIAYTGGLFEGAGIVDAFANADSARGLVMGSMVAMLITLWLYMSRGIVSFEQFMGAFAAGFRSMCAPMIILILSWNLSGITGLLGAAEFIHGIVESSASALQMFVPFVVFLISIFLAFSTGTSWGTFSILIPIVCAVFPASSEMLVISTAACLSGAVCGDHCSPISDTTIMSSAGAHCDHINHVSTQLPYAMTAAGASAVGYLLAGIIGYQSNSPAALMAAPVAFVVLFVMIWLLRRRAV